QQRAQRTAQSRRVDTSSPMFSSNRATTRSSSGGGTFTSIDVALLLTILLVMALRSKRGLHG
ncbi:MAG: hypothetical protein ABW153_02895, partial [Sedimenticola sp.]